MFSLSLQTFLIQWATGGLAFLWVTSRHRDVIAGYGLVLRCFSGLLALGAAVAGLRWGGPPLVTASSFAVVIACAVVGGVSFDRRFAGPADQRGASRRRAPWFVRILGVGRGHADPDSPRPEFPPDLDLIAPAVGLIGVIAGGAAAGDPAWLSVVRTIVGAGLMGAAFDLIVLGHVSVAQPGSRRDRLGELNRWVGVLTVVQVIALMVAPGMVSAFVGTIDDGYSGMLAWFWAACGVTTVVLVAMTDRVLREEGDSAIMAAMGLVHIVGLTAFGTDLVARAILSMG